MTTPAEMSEREAKQQAREDSGQQYEVYCEYSATVHSEPTTYEHAEAIIEELHASDHEPMDYSVREYDPESASVLWEVVSENYTVISKPVPAHIAGEIARKMTDGKHSYSVRRYQGEPEFVSNVKRARRVQYNRVRELLNEVADKANSIAGLQSPDWADVGDLSHIAAELSELVKGWEDDGTL